jgi:hypothetical protein
MVDYKLIYNECCCGVKGEELTLIRRGDELTYFIERYDRRTKTWITDDRTAYFLIRHSDKLDISENEVPKYLALFDGRDAECQPKKKKFV